MQHKPKLVVLAHKETGKEKSCWPVDAREILKYSDDYVVVDSAGLHQLEVVEMIPKPKEIKEEPIALEPEPVVELPKMIEKPPLETKEQKEAKAETPSRKAGRPRKS